MLRPAREAASSQPCPECDIDAERIVSDFRAFTFREGYARSIPDDRTYLHKGNQVQEKNSGGAPQHDHPELWAKKKAPDAVPTVEEFEKHEAMAENYGERLRPNIEDGLNPIHDEHVEKSLGSFAKRARSTAGRAKLKQRAKPNAESTPRTVSGKHGRSTKK